MKTFKQILNELKILRYMHIGPADLKPGDPIKSMTARLGKKAGRAAFKRKWGGFGDNEVYNNHADHVHLADPKDFTRDYHEWDGKKKKYILKKKPSPEEQFSQDLDFYGSGQVKKKSRKKMAMYGVQPGRRMKNLPVRSTDDLDVPHPMVKGEIEGRYVRDKWNPTTKKWERFK